MKQLHLTGSKDSSFNSYQSLINLYHEILVSDSNDINLSLFNLRWFDANLAAVLGAIIKEVEEKGYTITTTNMSAGISDILTRNGFLNMGDSYTPNSRNSDTVIAYFPFMRNQDAEFYNYINNEILSKDCFPNCSEAVKKSILRDITELFENARFHGKSDYIFTCGQHYPSRTPPRLDLTIVNMGKTFHENVNEFKQQMGEKPVIASHAIEWASIKKNTTKIGQTGGLGLSLLLEFLKWNKGKIQIISGNGYWEQNSYGRIEKTFVRQFPGTIINIEINTNDLKNYRLKSEIVESIENIF